MIRTSENDLICDLAETYHVYNWRALPPFTVAALAVGLRDSSRIKMRLSGARYPTETLLLAGIADRLSILIWQNTQDGRKGRNKPKMIVEQMQKPAAKPDTEVYNTAEEYEAAREKIRRKILNGGD